MRKLISKENITIFASINETMMGNKIRVAIYEDNAGLREILASIIRESEEFDIAGEFGHCLDVIKNTKALALEVIIMSIDMLSCKGI